MKKNCFIVFLMYAVGFLPTFAQREISSFKEVKISNGESYNVDGTDRFEPDVYFEKQADGTYKAIRLTVAPVSGTSAEITQPYLYMSTPTSICVGWKTGKQATGSVVRYGTSADNLDRSCQGTYVRLAGTYYWNTAKMEGLLPNTVYYYQVESGGRTSEVDRFRTMPSAGSGDKVRVLFIGDHQRNERSDYEWLLSAARRKAAEKYGDAPFGDNIRFVMNVGDQVDAGRTELYENVHLYKSRFVSPTLPTMTTVGNHEYKEDEKLRIYNGHYSAYGEYEYKGIKSGTANYYAYQAGPVLFVSINSDEPTAAQKMWIRKVVAAASADKTVDFIVSVQHRPLYAEQYAGDVSPWMTNEIMPILSSTPKHVLNCGGHHHLYARGQMTDTPVYHIISGGGVGTSAQGYEQLWGATPDNRNHDEVQKTIDHWTYQIFEFDPVAKEMTVETYSIGNSRLALDNVLVDRFARKVTGAAAPAAPVLVEPEGPVALPYVVSQAETVENLHSAQYQISKNADFTDIVVDKVRTFEDMYGVDGKYMPLDLNQGADVTKHTVENGTLANGTYYVRVRNRSMNLDWSDYSVPVSFTAEGADEPSAISLDGRFYRTGEPVTLTYDGAPVGQNAWVAVYVDGKRPGTSDLSYMYEYTSAGSGEWNFTINEPNVYFAVLFKDGGYTEITDRIRFVVSDNCDDGNVPELRTDKLVYDEGDPVVVSYSNATCIDKDWIGIYGRSVVPVDAKCPTYEYVGRSAEGSVTLNVSGTHNFASPVSKGVYFAGYFNADAYHESADRRYFVVGKPVMVDTDKETYGPSDNVNVVYEGMPGIDGDCILVFGKDGLVDKLPIGNIGGAVAIGPLPLGDYEVCAATAQGAEISERVGFSVTEPTGIDGVSEVADKVSVDGNTLLVSSLEAIGSVDVFSLGGTKVASCSAGGLQSVSLPVNSGKGVYFVSIDGKRALKFVLDE